jgi:hypothetical protein
MGPVRAVACGGNHSVVVGCAGELYTWGFGDLAQLANGRARDEAAPHKVREYAPVVEYAPSAVAEYAPSAVVEYAPSAVVEYAPSAVVEYAPSAVVEYAPSAVVEYAPSAVVGLDHTN